MTTTYLEDIERVSAALSDGARRFDRGRPFPIIVTEDELRGILMLAMSALAERDQSVESLIQNAVSDLAQRFAGHDIKPIDAVAYLEGQGFGKVIGQEAAVRWVMSHALPAIRELQSHRQDERSSSPTPP